MYLNAKDNLIADIDECLQMPGVCLHGRCKNDIGSFHCECQDGYVFNKDLLYCEGLVVLTECFF